MNNYTRIDSIAEQTITDALASLDITKGYIKGRYVDVYNKSSWRVGIISNVTSDTISVQYEGCNNNQDYIKIRGKRAAPFRRYTQGSTGQEVNQFRYNKINKDMIERKLEKLLSSSFTVNDPEEFVQFFRGDFFFYVDSLLTKLDVNNTDSEAVKDIMSFLNLCIKVIAEWIRDSWNLKPEFEAAETLDLLYKIHGRTALSTAYPELAEILHNLLGGSKRTIPTFRFLYGNSKNTIGNNEEVKMAVGWCVSSFYREFKTIGGLEEMIRMIKM